MTIGGKMQELMDWKGITQTPLANMTGISRSMISEYIRDVREPSIAQLRKIASALNVSPWTLINGEPMTVKTLDITEDECRVISAYRSLSTSGRELVNQTLRTLTKQG